MWGIVNSKLHFGFFEGHFEGQESMGFKTSKKKRHEGDVNCSFAPSLTDSMKLDRNNIKPLWRFVCLAEERKLPGLLEIRASAYVSAELVPIIRNAAVSS